MMYATDVLCVCQKGSVGFGKWRVFFGWNRLVMLSISSEVDSRKQNYTRNRSYVNKSLNIAHQKKASIVSLTRDN